jgi:hypothetical protein
MISSDFGEGKVNLHEPKKSIRGKKAMLCIDMKD